MRIIPEISQFPGGEHKVSFTNHKLHLAEAAHLDSRDFNNGKAFDVIALGQAVDILRHKGFKDIDLKMLYMPYSRQDRRMIPGESHSLKVFANIINSFGFRKVTTLDPHSDVCEALFNNLEILDNTEMLDWLVSHFYARGHKEIIVVAPDAGAYKKVFKSVSFVLNAKIALESSRTNYPNLNIEIITANKVRDVKTGDIIKTEVPILGKIGRYSGHVFANNIPIIILDDICDGGRTFIELSKAMVYNYKKSLIVSHGIFSKGLTELKSHYKMIVTSNSIVRSDPFEAQLNVVSYY